MALMRTYESAEKAQAVAKKAFWLAYQASVPMGMGFLHFREDAKEQDIVDSMVRPREDGIELYGDYVLGRMMKTGFRTKGNQLIYGDEARSDYQSWAVKYGTYGNLVDAAEKEVV